MKGTVYTETSLEDIFADLNLAPDFVASDGAPVLYSHRKTGGMDIYYLTNQSDKRRKFDGSFRVTGLNPSLWLPADGSVRPLPEYSDNGNATTLPLVLEPYESVFVLFETPEKKQKRNRKAKNFPEPVELADLDNALWEVSFQDGMRGPSEPLTVTAPRNLAEADNDSVIHFSGVVTYNTEFRLTKNDLKSGRILLNTGQLGVMGKVYVNGRYAGGVWCAPYKVDITPFVKRGDNSLRIDVVTTWVNRLIGDSALPEEERLTWTMQHPWNPSSPLQPSGLLEPVKIEKVAFTE